VAKIKFDLRDKKGDVDRYTLTISPKKGLAGYSTMSRAHRPEAQGDLRKELPRARPTRGWRDPTWPSWSG